LNDTLEKISKSVLSPPIITFHINCYNVERWTTKDNKGRTHHHSRKYYTHKASGQFGIREWENQLPPPSTLDLLSVLLIARLHTPKTIIYSPRATERFSEEKDQFIKDNKKDVHYEFKFTEDFC